MQCRERQSQMEIMSTNHAWYQFPDEKSGLRFQTNGETVRNELGEELVFPIAGQPFAEGYFGVALISGSRDEPNAEMFVGRIRAGTP